MCLPGASTFHLGIWRHCVAAAQQPMRREGSADSTGEGSRTCPHHSPRRGDHFIRMKGDRRSLLTRQRWGRRAARRTMSVDEDKTAQMTDEGQQNGHDHGHDHDQNHGGWGAMDDSVDMPDMSEMARLLDEQEAQFRSI